METTDAREVMNLLALSHSAIEHRLYESLLRETAAGGSAVGVFSVRQLMRLTGLGSYSTIKRARAGLVSKLSIDCRKGPSEFGAGRETGNFYQVYRPEEVFARRVRAGIEPYPKEYRNHAARGGFGVALERVVDGHNLSRREAQVALCCAEGLTNSEIGERLFITKQTVKFHLHHVFIKFDVRRRAELISRLLLRQDDADVINAARPREIAEAASAKAESA